MSKPTKTQIDNREEALEKLREIMTPGAVAQTILRHTSRSGMMRSISIVLNGVDYSFIVARALIERIDQTHGGIKVAGCGMDMGFHLVYSLASALYPDGFGCIGSPSWPRSCPSNDHSNGDRDFAPHDAVKKPWHKQGGYALRQTWL